MYVCIYIYIYIYIYICTRTCFRLSFPGGVRVQIRSYTYELFQICLQIEKIEKTNKTSLNPQLSARSGAGIFPSVYTCSFAYKK